MKKNKTLKTLIRFLSTKNWRGHKRSEFFQKAFQPIVDEGWIEYYDTSYSMACHELAEKYDYYPFDSEFEMNLEPVLTKYHTQNFKSLKVTIKRLSPTIKLFSGKGTYEFSVLHEGEFVTTRKTYELTLPII